jgi:hypothetical protein
MDREALPHWARGRRARAAGALASGLCLTATLAAAAAPPAPHTSVTNFPGDLLSVSAVSPSDAWATGEASPYSNAVALLHWNGSTWAQMTVPARKNSMLASVSADSANDAWAVGSTPGSGISTKDLALHWNGTSWAHVRVPSPGTAPVADNLVGVSADAPGDAWAVGFFFTIGGTTTSALALHWNGTAWTQVAVPDASQVELRAVTAKSPSDAWAVGDNLHSGQVVILHWNGTAWTQAATPAIPASLSAVTELSSTDVWAVGDGGEPDLSVVLHWDGTSWTRQPSPSPGGTATADISHLNGVSALSATDAWAVGFYGHNTAQFVVSKPLVLHWNGTAWTQTASPFFGTASGLESVQALSPANAWAVGAIFRRGGLDSTVVLHWNGTAWTRS